MLFKTKPQGKALVSHKWKSPQEHKTGTFTQSPCPGSTVLVFGGLKKRHQDQAAVSVMASRPGWRRFIITLMITIHDYDSRCGKHPAHHFKRRRKRNAMKTVPRSCVACSPQNHAACPSVKCKRIHCPISACCVTAAKCSVNSVANLQAEPYQCL